MNFADVFAGIGGFSIGMTLAGMNCVLQVEKNEQCRKILERHFPGVERRNNIIGLHGQPPPCPIDLICFGDPCPKHSRARSNGKSKHPDLSGYCLAMAGRWRTQWVVRENVPAATVAHFAAGLEALGYGTVVIRVDSATHTGQSRQRDYVVGRYQASRESVRGYFPHFQDGAGTYKTVLGTEQVVPALTTHRTRYDSRDCYVWDEKEKGLRILDGDERETFAGFPKEWTAGLSEAARARVYGNAATPLHAYEIGMCIMRQNQDER